MYVFVVFHHVGIMDEQIIHFGYLECLMLDMLIRDFWWTLISGSNLTIDVTSEPIYS